MTLSALRDPSGNITAFIPASPGTSAMAGEMPSSASGSQATPADGCLITPVGRHSAAAARNESEAA